MGTVEILQQQQMDQRVGKAYKAAMGDVLDRLQLFAIVWTDRQGVTWYWSKDAGWIISPNNASYFPYLQQAKRALLQIDVLEARVHPVYTYIAAKAQL